MKTIKALVSFVYIGANGSITSYAGGQIYEVANEIATQFISIGYAEEYSGGGSSDFSTAEVTISADGIIDLYGSIVWNSIFTENVFTLGLLSPGEEPKTYQVILYKGKAMIFSDLIDLGSNTTLIGDIVWDDEEMGLIITGNGSIHISNGQ